MLHNIPLNSTSASTAVIEGVLHETLSIPAGGGTANATKAAFSKTSGHFRGLIINTSGLTSTGQVAYFMATCTGDPPPSRDVVLTSGVPLTPAGSVLELPENANLEYYFAASGAISIKGVYFIRSA